MAEVAVPGLSAPIFVLPSPNVDSFGAKGDGVTDDTAAIIAAEATRLSYQTLTFTPGKTYKVNSGYDGSAAQKALLFRIAKPGAWDLSFVTLKWGSAFNLTTGADGGALGMVNIMVGGFRIIGGGTLDGQGPGAGQVQTPITINGDVSGCQLDVTIIGAKEPGIWIGIAYATSADIVGGTIATRAKNVSGTINRPSCPIWDQSTDTITDHKDCTAILIGGAITLSNTTGCAFVICGTEVNVFLMALNVKGVLNFISRFVTGNTGMMDFAAYDLGAYAIELYGPFRMLANAALVWGAAVAVDANAGNRFFLTATSNIAATISAPTNPPLLSAQTQTIEFVIFNNSGGALTTPVAFAAGAGAFLASGGVSPANGLTICVRFAFDQVRNRWIETSRGAAV